MNRRTRLILVSAAALVVTLAAAVRYLGSTEAAPSAPGVGHRVRDLLMPHPRAGAER